MAKRVRRPPPNRNRKSSTPAKADSVAVRGWRRDAIEGLAKRTRWSRQEVVDELLGSALCGEVSPLHELLLVGRVRAGGDCPEECKGTGQQATTRQNERCPKDCETADEMQDIVDDAKSRARRYAIEVCLKANPACVCEGGTYKELEKYCKTLPPDNPLPRRCLRLARYEYTGSCKNDP